MYARLSFVALLGLAGVLVGCGDDDATRDTGPATTVSAETTVPPSLEQIDAMLLDTTDVGVAWQLGPTISDADLTDAMQVPCPDTAVDSSIADRLTPITGVQFEPVDLSSEHLIEFAVTGEPEQLDADLQVLFDAMDACAAATSATIGTGSLTVEPLTIPELGDQQGAYTLVGVESPDATWYVRRAQVRVGPIAVEVSLTEILRTPDDEPNVSDAEFGRLVQTAVAKLHGGTTSDLANPASEYCVEQGGQVEIVDEVGGQVGYCALPDGRRVEEWEYFRSQTSPSEP